MSLFDSLIAKSIGLVPKFIVRRVAARYVAGEDLAAAMQAGAALEAEGCCTTFDLLGEFVRDAKEADASATEYIALLEALDAHKLTANVSVKLTAFGLMLDEEATYSRVVRVVKRARELGRFVRLDMEDTPWTDATLGIYRRLRGEGYDNVGVVLQAYLRRTLDDIDAMAELQPSYRLCKGIYVEPEELAFKGAQEIRDHYMKGLRKMFEGGASYVGIATHDEALVNGAMALIRELEIPKERYEFQMLLGVTEPLRRRILDEGHDLRVYVPYGGDWYGYCVRRLKENPKIGRHVLFAMFKRR